MQNESTKIAMMKNLQDIQKQKMQEQAQRNDKEMRRKPGVIATMRAPEELFGAR